MCTIPCRGRFETCPYKTILFIAQHSRNQIPVVKAGDCFGQDPRTDADSVLDDMRALFSRRLSDWSTRNDAGYAFDEIRYVVIASEAKQSLSYK
ncbi:MAG: hypothetical protein BROFUL_00584 [Candidatus Brocadia fulgida]|uniref:Uncharacterized protein n=1 Tax=Candidatus Brocadia fulgida TaxID=380242 RepID=A0A0M2V0I7_9BACT|nr:MAG: hypothetical protein BROFUL_00584 [Candidatus Brocadia fulgida]